MTAPPEVWLRGPVPGIQPLLQPAAHALLQVGEDVLPIVQHLMPAQLWARPGGAAAIGFHLAHLPGSLDRLLTYSRGESLSPDQLSILAAERQVHEDRPELADRHPHPGGAGVNRAASMQGPLRLSAGRCLP